MRINRVVLENYGLYAGRNDIDLIPRRRGGQTRPIILVGGKNGAGKTTLMDGVRLALYGKTALGERLSEREYHECLKGLIHRDRNPLLRDYARVGVEFDFVLRGTRETYFVERLWDVKKGGSVQETFHVRKRQDTSQAENYNSWPTLAEIESEHWQTFVNDVVPERLSQLFFFDGEKIKRIADDITGDQAIAGAIRSLLGLDTVSRLKADLAILAARETKRYLSNEESEVLIQFEKEIKSLRDRDEKLNQDQAQIATEIAGIEGEVRSLEMRLREEGGVFAGNRETWKEREQELSSEIDDIQKQIRIECEGLFPLALCPRLTEIFEDQAHHEFEIHRQTIIRRELEDLQRELASAILLALSLNGRAEEANRIIAETFATRLSKFGDSREAGPSSIGMSDQESVRIAGWLRDARETALKTMRSLCKRLEARERDAQRTRQHLMMAPSEAVLAPLFADLSVQNQILGAKRAAAKALAEECGSLNHTIQTKLRQMAAIREKSEERASSEQRVGLITQSQVALDQYLLRLTDLKVEALCRTVMECFKRLSRKGDLLQRISINSRTFAITLHADGKDIVHREELSAGEKQILAIAILWGLAKTSGRPLPVIIDTPLARLDSDHRMNLVQNYFPHAGHQVVLLSTDTEVDRELFDALKPNISHCYRLTYDKAERCTRLEEEYFWKNRNHD